MLGAERLPEQWVVLEEDLPDREVVGGLPVAVHAPEQLRRERRTTGGSAWRRLAPHRGGGADGGSRVGDDGARQVRVELEVGIGVRIGHAISLQA